MLLWLSKVSKEMGKPVDEVQEEASAILEEMAQRMQLSTVRFFAFTLSKVFKTLFRSICVNEDGIQRVSIKTDTQWKVFIDKDTPRLICVSTLLSAPAGHSGTPGGSATESP